MIKANYEGGGGCDRDGPVLEYFVVAGQQAQQKGKQHSSTVIAPQVKHATK
jgi:hypothetical protein